MPENNHEQRHPAHIPDPLQQGDIEGQNPNTPERLPGHTKYYTGVASPDLRQHAGSLLAIATIVCALFALIAILAAS